MSTYRETPCKHYLAYGNCAKGREAHHKGYCQHCNKYEQRARVHNINRKKAYNETARGKTDDF